MIYLNPIPLPPSVGDVAYWDGFQVKTTPLSKWNTSLGTPVGVVVVPTGFAPDGKVRIVSLYGVDANGNQSSADIGNSINIAWGGYGTNTSLRNHTKVPITENTGNANTGSNSYGFLPSNAPWFSGTTSFVDSKVKYNSASYITNYMIPSPYLGDRLNLAYLIGISGNNALSDFNGLSNTQTLVGSATTYTAANVAWNYNDGSSDLQWYLPAMGELGFVMPRLNEINTTISKLGGKIVTNNFWSSSECDGNSAYRLRTFEGEVRNSSKNDNHRVRPFAIIN